MAIGVFVSQNDDYPSIVDYNLVEDFCLHTLQQIYNGKWIACDTLKFKNGVVITKQIIRTSEKYFEAKCKLQQLGCEL